MVCAKIVTSISSWKCQIANVFLESGGIRKPDECVNATGESPSLLKHFDELRQKGDTNVRKSPYANAPWEVNKKFETVDFYEITVMVLMVVPQIVVLYPILFVLLLAPVGFNMMYVTMMVPNICDSIPRTTAMWRIHCITQVRNRCSFYKNVDIAYFAYVSD